MTMGRTWFFFYVVLHGEAYTGKEDHLGGSTASLGEG